MHSLDRGLGLQTLCSQNQLWICPDVRVRAGLHDKSDLMCAPFSMMCMKGGYLASL